MRLNTLEAAVANLRRVGDALPRPIPVASSPDEHIPTVVRVNPQTVALGQRMSPRHLATMEQALRTGGDVSGIHNRAIELIEVRAKFLELEQKEHPRR